MCENHSLSFLNRQQQTVTRKIEEFPQPDTQKYSLLFKVTVTLLPEKTFSSFVF